MNLLIPASSEVEKGCLVVADDGTGNFVGIKVPTSNPLIAIREALPYLEEHVEETDRIKVIAYPDTYVPDAEETSSDS